VLLLADVLVKHAAPPPGVEVEQLAEDTFRRGRADALIVTGSGTGKQADPQRLALVQRAVPEAPVLVGSGVTAAAARELLGRCDGLIVGSAVSHDEAAGTGVDADRARALVRAARG
jgi:hypothetical protein